MFNDVDIIDKNVKFDGYSSSRNFLGFFDRKKRYTCSTTRKAIDLFFKKMLTDEKNIHVVSSLFINENLIKHHKSVGENKIVLKKLLQTIQKLGLIRLIPEYQLEKYDDLEYEELSTSWVTFEVKDFIQLRNALYSYMRVGGIEGHIFIILRNKSMIAYPHNDDTGFGFIGFNTVENKKFETIRQQLRELFTTDDFRFFYPYKKYTPPRNRGVFKFITFKQHSKKRPMRRDTLKTMTFLQRDRKIHSWVGYSG